MIEIKSDLKPMSDRYRQRAAAINGYVLRAEHESANQIYRTAQKLSSGRFPEAALKRARRRRGHGLYSTAAPAPPNDPAILNAQTSRLKRSWRYRVSWKKDGTQISIWNTAPYAKFLYSGTEWMIPRPIMEKIREIERGPRLRRLAAAKRAAISKR